MSGERFADLLSQAIRRIAANENKTTRIVQDTLGYAIGRRSGGSSLDYWRRGHIPNNHAEIETLTTELARRGGFFAYARD